MKVGDLVELSAYGKSANYLRWLPKDEVGLVIGSSVGYGSWKILWYGKQREIRMDRKHLKHAKVRK